MKKTCSRTASLIAGFVIMLCFGLLYAWSIYSAPLGPAFGWTSAQLGLCFTAIMIAFCLGGILGSVLTRRFGARRAILAGSVLSLLGYGCAVLLSGGIWLLYVSFSISGLGCGVVYNPTVSTVVMRFPEKKGFASGILLMGFGSSTLVLGSFASGLMSVPGFGWRGVYIATGALLFLVGVFAGGFIVQEPSASADPAALGRKDLSPGQMFSSASFWLYFSCASILSFFGQGVIGHARSIALEGGVPVSLAALTVGLCSVSNGLGRIIFGALHDKKGYKSSLMLDAAVLIAAGALLAVFLKQSAPVVIVAALMLCGLGYGAVPPISASVTQEFFGSKYYAQNLSFMNLSIIAASFASAIMGGIQTSTGSYVLAAAAFSGLEILPIILVTVLSGVRKNIDRSKISDLEGKP